MPCATHSVDGDPEHFSSSLTGSQAQCRQACLDVSLDPRLYSLLPLSWLFQKPSQSVYPRAAYRLVQYEKPRNFCEPWFGMHKANFEDKMRMTGTIIETRRMQDIGGATQLLKRLCFGSILVSVWKLRFKIPLSLRLNDTEAEDDFIYKIHLFVTGKLSNLN